VLQVVRSGYFGVRVGNWKKKNLQQFFCTCNIKASEADRVLAAAEADKEQGVVNATAVEPKFLTLNDCFDDTYKYPDLPMHGMAHGMIPDVMEITHAIFSKYSKKKPFYDYANVILADVATFRLDYCKLKTLPKAAWVGENVMGYARLMCYIYGSYLANNPLGATEEAAITTHHLKCMWNAFNVFVSYLMSDKTVDTDLVDSHMKIFMSLAHYLHKEHGNLDKKSDDQVGPGEKSRRKNIFLSEIGREALVSIAHALGKQTHGTENDLRRRINYVTQKQLREKLDAMQVEWRSTMSKSDLQRLIFAEVRPSQSGNASDPPRRRKKAETMCRNCGNWLSFMANIAKQIAYLGSLRLIWWANYHLINYMSVFS